MQLSRFLIWTSVRDGRLLTVLTPAVTGSHAHRSFSAEERSGSLSITVHWHKEIIGRREVMQLVVFQHIVAGYTLGAVE